MFKSALHYFIFLSAVSFASAGVDLNREMILVASTGATAEDAAIRTWQRRIDGNGAQLADFDRLGWAFVAKARRSLDVGYYKLAEKTADVMDAQFGASPDSALLRGHVYHNLHRFGDAEAIARRLVNESGTPDDLALLSDALMEQGKLVEAINALQRMANAKPGAEADSRIAHIRWLKGDLAGATQAMEQAVRETSPQDDESLAWMLSRLSGYWLQAGKLWRAGLVATAALKHLPDYAPALLAQGRIRLAEGKPTIAVPLLSRAAQLNPLPEYQWWLADALRAIGEATKANAVEAELRSHGEATDPRSLAVFLATRGENPTEALRLARVEIQKRADVLTHDALAWALFGHGDRSAAMEEIRAALAEGTKDARLLLHAAVIVDAAGKLDEVQHLVADCEAMSSALLPCEHDLLQRVRKSLAVNSRAQPGSVAERAPAKSTALPGDFLAAAPDQTANSEFSTRPFCRAAETQTFLAP